MGGSTCSTLRFGKGSKAERARNVLRELVGVGEGEEEEAK
jgi:hypothetical protein